MSQRAEPGTHELAMSQAPRELAMSQAPHELAMSQGANKEPGSQQ